MLAGAASKWHAHILSIGSIVVIRSTPRARRSSKSSRAVCEPVAFCKIPPARHSQSCLAHARSSVAFVMFHICFDQMQDNLTSQPGRKDTNATSNDLVPAMNQVGCIVLGPLIERGGIYPFLHRRRVYLTPVIRITIGFALVALAMLHATIVCRS